MNLPAEPQVDLGWKRRLLDLLEESADDPPPDLSSHIQDRLGVDLSTRYAGIDIAHPFGKASGQLSCTLPQVQHDVEAGIGFIVLKTVLAETAAGERSMEAWALDETRMRVEKRTTADGRRGWNVAWRGRGWSGSLEEYAAFFAGALAAARDRDVAVIPSVKFHLPHLDEDFRVAEYTDTVQRLLTVWEHDGCGGPMVLEKDFSPTLAADARADEPKAILRWMREVPGLVSEAAPSRTALVVKLMNALHDDAFQMAMVRTVAAATPRPASLVVFNRLVDRATGEAFGGWELSDRNWRVLEAIQQDPTADWVPPLSATGNICSGRVMVEYAARGAENGQVHTFFQVPLAEYTATGGTRTARALHTLLLHPTDGLVVWARHLLEAGTVDERGGVVHFRDIIGCGRGRP